MDDYNTEQELDGVGWYASKRIDWVAVAGVVMFGGLLGWTVVMMMG